MDTLYVPPAIIATVDTADVLTDAYGGGNTGSNCPHP